MNNYCVKHITGAKGTNLIQKCSLETYNIIFLIIKTNFLQQHNYKKLFNRCKHNKEDPMYYN